MNPTFFLVARSATADPWCCKRNNKAGGHVNSYSMQRDRAKNEKVQMITSNDPRAPEMDKEK